MFRLLSWQLCKGGLEEAEAKCTGVSSRLLEQAGGGARGGARTRDCGKAWERLEDAAGAV